MYGRAVCVCFEGNDVVGLERRRCQQAQVIVLVFMGRPRPIVKRSRKNSYFIRSNPGPAQLVGGDSSQRWLFLGGSPASDSSFFGWTTSQ